MLVLSSECAIGKKQRSCDELELMANISVAQRNWLAFLATRRDTYVIPTANCLGYIQCKRNDGRVDPNRDFPYSRQDSRCMQSPTARLFRHVMAQNLVQLVVTFHSGMVAIGYEWGSKNHMAPRDRSPDDSSNKVIGELMVDFGGAFRREKRYPGASLVCLRAILCDLKIAVQWGASTPWCTRWTAAWRTGSTPRAGTPPPSSTATAPLPDRYALAPATNQTTQWTREHWAQMLQRLQRTARWCFWWRPRT